ncbi:MAG: ketoacyl-ACP synthase III [Candidatus Rokubacteria bacterium]|nr:ketoacyl-ACP synthase III [Candidatus Rokubacteria bacterium]
MIYQRIGARVAATGSYSPPRIVTNEELSDGAGKKLRRLLGISERRVAAAHEACSDLIAEAGKRALETAHISPLDLDRIIVSATPGDFVEPPTASVVQYKLGARCPAVDVKMSCVGWLAGVDYALRCIATGERAILVLAGTIISKGDPFKSITHQAIFGDGAGATLIEANGGAGHFLAGTLWTDGQHYTKINLPHPASVHPPEIPEEFRGKFYMGSQRTFFQHMREVGPPLLEGMLKEAGLTKEEIDVVILHQPSKPLFEVALKALEFPREKVVNNLRTHGNTISAELPIALDQSIRSGRIKRGDKVLLVTFGAGFNAGATVMIY